MKFRQRSRSGFTIVELLIAIVVIAILAAITVVAYSGVKERAEESSIAADLRSAAQEVEARKAATGQYPASYGGPGSASAGSQVQYSLSDDGERYCITGIRGKKAMRITPGATAEDGICTGHNPPGEGYPGETPGEPPIASLSCPTGFVPIPGNARFSTGDFCVMKYEAKNVNGVAVSRPDGEIWTFSTGDSRPQLDIDVQNAAKTACDGCQLVTQGQWLTIAHDIISVGDNWTTGIVGQGTLFTGHSDGDPGRSLLASDIDSEGYIGTGNSSPSSQRRTFKLSNGEYIWDFAGNMAEFTDAKDVIAGVDLSIPTGLAEYNSPVLASKLPMSFYPSFGTPLAAGWSSDQGLGMVQEPSSTDPRESNMLVRGGSWSGDEGGGSSGYALAGLFALVTRVAVCATIGFRASR